MRDTDTGLIQCWRERLPLAADAKAVSLHEGNTPLIPLNNLPKKLNWNVDVFVKYEGLNPTGSFKDRGMAVAVTQARYEEKCAVICASTGNTSASAAAYAARCGIKAFVLIPEGKIAMGKLAQAVIEGAIIIQIKGNFDQGMQLVKNLAQKLPVAIVNSINPYRLQGQKTAAFEIIEALGQAPDYHCLPVGNAGNITAYWMGYSEAAGNASRCIESARQALGDKLRLGAAMTDNHPKMLGYQASGAAPILSGKPVEQPETVATAIRIGNPQNWHNALAAVRESEGWFAEVTDEEILSAQRMLASEEGIFCEPASAASIAGLIKDLQIGRIAKHSCVVCTLTGHGLKDPDIAMKASGELLTVDADLEVIKQVITAKIMIK